MKKLWIYFVAVCAAMLTVACEKTDADGYAAGEGGVVMNLANTRAVDMSDKTLSDCTIFIYQKGTDSEPTLIRKYAPGNCPKTIKLLAGSYSVKVRWGEHPAAAAFDKCFYEGSADFTITAGATEHVTVACQPQSTAVEVIYDAHIAEHLSDYKAVVALPDDTKPENALTFTESETGYFTLPEGVTTLDWSFSATHPTKGPVQKEGQIADVKAGNKYTLTFHYSPDLPGYISISIAIEEPEKEDDVCVFSQDPTVDLVEKQDHTSAELPEGIDVTMKATAEGATVKTANIYLDGGNVVSLASTRAAEGAAWTWTEETGPSNPDIATAALSADKKTLTVRFLSKKVFSNAAGKVEAGKTNCRFEVEDSSGSKADKMMTIRIEGVCPVTPSDYDLWENDITLHVISFNGEPTSCKIQQEGSTGEWAASKIEKMTAENEYAVTFVPEWVESYNAKALANVYKPKTGCGIFAKHSYTASVAIGGTTYDATFATDVDQPILNSDMSDTSYSCFTEENKEAVFWGSGNNKYAPALCAPGTKSGSSCAHLKSTMAGAMGIEMLASGNLFTGTFYRPSTTGTVSFGKFYDWKARPTKLRLMHHATIGKVNQQKHKKDGAHPANIGDQDKAIIYVAIVDWTKPHDVSSGTKAPTGMWSPDATVNPGEGAIIGYGVYEIEQSTDGLDLVPKEIEISYYNTTTKPSADLTLVISCATNIYGDYMCGCDTNELWVTDFEWVY